jgi:flagellar biosynthesis protein FlhA
LVAQIPALIISTAAGVIVSRVGSSENVGTQLVGQIFSNRNALVITAGVLALIGVIPGMPHFAFLCLAAGAAGLAYARTAAKTKAAAEQKQPQIAALPSAIEATWEDVAPVDVLGLEVGYRLVPLVDSSQDGELLKRIKSLRRKFAQEIGFLPPAVHIRDNLELRPNAYRLTLKGVTVAQGEAYNGMFLAINPGNVGGMLQGTVTKDPAFGLPAVWIESVHREHALGLGYTVVDAGTVVATHLNNVVQTHAAELLGRHEVQQLLDMLGKTSPKLVEELTPKLLPLSSVQRCCKTCSSSRCRFAICYVVETLSDHGARVQDVAELAALVRTAWAARSFNRSTKRKRTLDDQSGP